MTIDLRPLRQFVALAEDLHFGRAAKRLHMTLPRLSPAMQQLEARLGVRLFERTRRSVSLTAAGDALLLHARRLLLAADDLPRLVQAAAEGFSGQLRLAFVSSIAYGPLPGWLRGFREAHPEVQLQLREATLDVQLGAFDADEIDAGFVLHAPGAAPAGFAAWMALQEPLVLALPDVGRPSRAPALKEVLAQPLVIFPRYISPSLYDAVLAFYRAHGVAPRIAQEAIQMQTIVNLVSVGMGVAWVPNSVTQVQRPGVVYRRLPGARLDSETSLLWREPALPVVQRFVNHVRAQRRADRPPAAKKRAVHSR
jgi:DNA-binding transcriptional LysR family regulator